MARLNAITTIQLTTEAVVLALAELGTKLSQIREENLKIKVTTSEGKRLVFEHFIFKSISCFSAKIKQR